MSSNNQIVIIKNSEGKFEVHHHLCVDNDFVLTDDSLLFETNTLEMAIKTANKFMEENIVEYGLNIQI